MEVAKYYIKEAFHQPKNFQFLHNHVDFLIFDIETTGLNPNIDKIILIGMLFVKNDQIIITQLFCNNKTDEVQLLQKFSKIIEGYDLYITYNGNTFDIPFLNKRLEINKIPYVIDRRKSFDLLKTVRSNRDLLNLPDCKLKTLEKFLGIQRTDTISGAESVLLYEEYVRSKDERLKHAVLLHNHDDLYYLGKCLSFLEYIPLNNLLQKAPIMVKEEGTLCSINHIKIRKKKIHASGTCFSLAPFNQIHYDQSYNFSYDVHSNTFDLTVPLYTGQLLTGESCLFINQQEFPIFNNCNTSVEEISPYIIQSNDDVNHLSLYEFIKSLMRYILQHK
ncbi:MAG: ribonuclease H-like domain-containing protein [Bacillota bacterium]